MEKYKVTVTFEALEELTAIEDYLLENQSEETADYVIEGLIEAIQTLENMPTRHPLLRLVEKKSILIVTKCNGLTKSFGRASDVMLK